MEKSTGARPRHKIVSRRPLLKPDRKKFEKRARTFKDWEDQEENELNIPTRPDYFSDWIGTHSHRENYYDALWRKSWRDDPETVSRYYPHEKLIMDLPETDEDLQRRIEMFEQLGIRYMYLHPGEELDETEFKKRLKRIRRDHEKANRSRVAAGVC